MKFKSVVFIVESPEASASFYSKLLGLNPVVVKPTFAQFDLGNGIEFAIWGKSVAQPPAEGKNPSAEICFDADDLAALHTKFVSEGVTILAPPFDLDFGSSMVVLDPDGNRVRFLKENI